MRKPSVGIIFLTVFIDLIGFGLVIPLLPIYAKNFNATGWQIALVMAAYSFMQFVFAPFLGRLSDRIGRRPVLLTSTAGAAVSYLIFAYASMQQGGTALILLIASRAFAGVCGANITVAQAYIADITPPENRSKRMGLIGMAFGLGFIFGPILAAVARTYFGDSGPGWAAFALCAINFFLALTILPESWKPSSEHVAPRPHLAQWMHTLSRPKVGLLIGIFFLATFCFTCFESTLGLLILSKFSLKFDSAKGIRTVSYLFIYAGLVGALVQGGATGRLVKALGEPKLIALSLFLVAISLGPLPFAQNWTQVLILLALLSIGSSLTRPPVFGMISNFSSAQEQGVTIGVAQSAGSLARIIGPLFALPLFTYQQSYPYLICGAISLLTGILAWQRLSRDHAPAVAAEPQKAGS
ncbi:MFS transporter [Pedosphaera parvula]|uniref:Major facilitator superfamily MFS_1 n=1 Tax=Pedosphaera parvula (strain Ellin514) TaxID=320771 RepID=B9XIE9_PEDPL|nr:tetracycline resistance MFS efflux pump [Pedosphaera parvula]EEF60410.1 major facilitator superfamily MFS_1 [Pedosphaera parvula Ellin514]